MKFKKRILILSFLVLFLGPGFVFAREVPIFEGLDLPNLIAKIFSELTLAAIILSILVIVFGGLCYLVSFGTGKIMGVGKDWIKAGLLGLFLVLSSYLILWTINPDLVSLKMTPLIPIPIPGINPPGVSPGESVPTIAFNEIPIGTLTENLLTRTMDCYGFDENGDPIDGDPSTPELEPTFRNHDRADCILKLSEAATRKAEIFKDLSEKIANLMDNCSCREAEEPEAPPYTPGGAFLKEPNDNDFGSFLQQIRDLTLQKTQISLAADTGCTPGTIKWCADCSKQQCDSSGNWGACIPFDFSLSISPGSASVTTGENVPISVNVRLNSGFVVYPVTFYVREIPLSGGASYSPASCTPSCSSTLTLKTQVGSTYAWPNDYSVVVRAVGCNVAREVSLALEVLPGPPLGFHAEESSKEKVILSWKKGLQAQKTRVTRDGKEICFPWNSTQGNICSETGLDPESKYCYEARSWTNNKWSKEVVSTCNDPETEKKGECKSIWGNTCNYQKITSDPKNCNKNACDVKGRCTCPDETPDCDPCPDDVREITEHGPITVEECGGEGEKEYKGLDEFRSQHTDLIGYLEKTIKINGEDVRIIQIDRWNELRLIDQLKYFQQKLKQLKTNIEDDLNLLKDAENKLTNCYAPKTYVDLFRAKEGTSEKEIKISIQKIFSDPVTKKVIDASKYCKGFGYANASIFNACKKICAPGNNLKSFNALKGCGSDDADCIKKSYYTCGNNAGFGTFEQCLDSLREKCKQQCQSQYPDCPDLLQGCLDLCDEDSKFLEDGEDCYLNLKSIKECAYAYDAFEDFKRCVENSMCVYCTDQYTGYPDCLKEPAPKSEPYSPLYLYQHPTRQKDWQSTFFAKIFNKNKISPVYPESAKCPFFSKCPKCPCEDDQCTVGETGEKRLYCNGDCGEYAYGGDPLTFYCVTQWIPEWPPEKLGWVCPKNDEIPIGETVDESEKWAEDLMKEINNFLTKTEDMIEYIKKIGDERGYCECWSVCQGNERACEANCEYQEQQITYTNPDTGETSFYWLCYCIRKPCEGNPCQKMINLLRGKAANEKCPKGVEFKGVAWYYEEMKKAFEKLKEFILKVRSEIFKKLIYSRKKMNEGSGLVTEFGSEIKALLNCRNAYLGTYILKERCYGALEGRVRTPAEILLDNWFSCTTIVR